RIQSQTGHLFNDEDVDLVIVGEIFKNFLAGGATTETGIIGRRGDGDLERGIYLQKAVSDRVSMFVDLGLVVPLVASAEDDHGTAIAKNTRGGPNTSKPFHRLLTPVPDCFRVPNDATENLPGLRVAEIREHTGIFLLPRQNGKTDIEGMMID